MVLFSILSEIDKNNFHFDEELFPHYTRMIGMVDNFEFIAGHTSEFSKSHKFLSEIPTEFTLAMIFIFRCKNGSFFDFDTRRK